METSDSAADLPAATAAAKDAALTSPPACEAVQDLFGVGLVWIRRGAGQLHGISKPFEVAARL